MNFAVWSKNLDSEAQQDFAGRVISADLDFGAQTPERCERLAKYKLPKHVAYLHELPRDDNGKLYKRKLRDPEWAGREKSI